MIALANLRQHPVFAEIITGLTNWPDDIGGKLIFLQMVPGALGERHDLVVAVVKGGAGEIVHRRINDDKILHTGLLHVLHPCDEDAAVTCDEAARLDKDLQAKRLEQRDEFGCVLR